MSKLLLLLCFLCGMQGSVFCQSLKVGDRLEGIKAGKSSAKLLILDFWSINCASCIRAFPKLQDLQNHFDPQMEIVLVSRESKMIVDEFYGKRKQLQKPALRFIYGDTALNQKFKDYAYPFQVWLDSNGRIATITEVADISVQTIEQFLSGEHIVDASARKRKIFSSLIETGMEQYKAPVLYYSYLTKCSDTIKVGNSIGAQIKEGMVRLSEDCASVLRLYRTAYSENGKYMLSNDFNIVLDQVNPETIYPPKERESQRKWDKENKYTYDLVIAKERSEEIFAMMQYDLYRHFGYQATLKRGRCQIIQLLSRPGANLLATKGGVPQIIATKIHDADSTVTVRIRNKPFDTLVNVLRRYLPNVPMEIEDRSYYRELGNIDLEIVIELSNKLFVGSLRNELAKYNLVVYATSEPIDILVLSGRK